jgi:hypothetical protein
MLKKFATYMKYYFEIKHKDVAQRALESYRDYTKAHPDHQFDINFCQGYQRGYVHAYRQSYAKAKIDNLY